MPEFDYRPNQDAARVQFPQLLSAAEQLDKLFKKLRGLRNKGLATDIDVEHAREARRLVLNILDRGALRDAICYCGQMKLCLGDVGAPDEPENSGEIEKC